VMPREVQHLSEARESTFAHALLTKYVFTYATLSFLYIQLRNPYYRIARPAKLDPGRETDQGQYNIR
jgi:hypothetical protein